MNPLATHTVSTKKTPSIGIFIFASALLHAGLLGLPFPSHSLPGTPNNNASLNVAIQNRSTDVTPNPREMENASSQPHQPKQNTLVRPVTRASMRATKPVKIEARASAKPSAIQHQETQHSQTSTTPAEGQTIAPSDTFASSTTEPRTPADVSPAGEARLKVITHEIVSLMETFRRFPPLARQRGWEGEVLLSFRLNQLGIIDNIKVAHGSGFAILDENAMDTLRRVGNIEKSTSWLPRNSVDVSLPVVYALTKG